MGAAQRIFSALNDWLVGRPSGDTREFILCRDCIHTHKKCWNCCAREQVFIETGWARFPEWWAVGEVVRVHWWKWDTIVRIEGDLAELQNSAPRGLAHHIRRLTPRVAVVRPS